MLDLQTRKLQFIEEYLRLTDEAVIEKLAQLLREEKQKVRQAKSTPMRAQELVEKLERSEMDIREDRLHTQDEVEQYFKNRRAK